MFDYNLFILGLIGLAALLFCTQEAQGSESLPQVKVSTKPMHSGKISPLIYGAFIELLDDLVPGMWAEMLNDRGFDGILRNSNWVYHTGEPTICDRKWDENPTWTLDEENPFNGSYSARLTAAKDTPGSLTQTGLAVTDGLTYHFSGYFRASNPNIQAEVILKFKLPDGKWFILGSKQLPALKDTWHKVTCDIPCNGTADRVVFEIKTTGEGSVWVDKLSLMPSDNIKGWRADVVKVVKEANPAQIRWGGCIVDPGGYRWKDCIGDRDLRTSFLNPTWGRLDSNDVGIDEFLQFCELVDAEPLVCVSFADGPESAADLMHYCNDDASTEWGQKRAANGHPEPYNVKYWQIGNELGRPEYVAGCVEFCKLMRSVDPDIVILASYPSQNILEQAGQYLDYVCPHHYSGDLEWCKKSIEDSLELIRKIVPDRNVKIGITEWNVTAGDWGIVRARIASLGWALKNAEYLNFLHRYSNVVDIANRSNLTNSFYSGMIQTRPDGVLKTPAYYVMKLYADHTKPIPLPVSGTPEGLDISACRSEDGRELCLFAVNTSAEPVEFELDLSEFGSGIQPVESEIVCDTADQRQYDLMNHWTAPERVKTVSFTVQSNKIIVPAYSAAAIEYSK
ncbi:MAG TPA: alpha-L-arabinofuranosidase C-terminal domain-containing protein [Armatimonadota bacterium]|nr:alpha-L-arabinofuranosidase C-terminal domain-containing protein [Armatimonadota bacterium]